jgi:hypothetical protein
MATDSVKVLIVERNGIDLEDQEEFDLVAEVVPFTAPGYVADNVKDAILESTLNATDIHAGQHQVDDAENILVKAKKQMRVFQQLVLDGTLTLDGWLIID